MTNAYPFFAWAALKKRYGPFFVRAVVLALALLSMAHVGSPDTFFVGDAGPYAVRVSVRLPGVIPGRAQVEVRIVGATAPDQHRVAVRAGQWNVGLAGAPPPDQASPVPGDPSLYATEIWLMTATSYQLFVAIDGPSGPANAVVPVLALATERRTMTASLGIVLATLGGFLVLGMLTIIGGAVRESVLPPGLEPDARLRRRARVAVGAAAAIVCVVLWGASKWWAAEASSYAASMLYRPFASNATVQDLGDRRMLTLAIRDPRWTGQPLPVARYSALMPDHGKLMHLFLVREGSPDGFAHLHPIARTPAALDFDAAVPSLAAGRYRVFADIVHESGYAQTLVSSVDVPVGSRPSSAPTDPDDSWFEGRAAAEASSAAFTFPDGSQIVWQRGEAPIVRRDERLLAFSARDRIGARLAIEPYMGMSAHVAIAHEDGSVFAHLHPFGSISMAALERFTKKGSYPFSGPPSDAHAAHRPTAESDVVIPYAFPKPGRYRMWVQMQRGGRVMTAAFDAAVMEAREQPR